MIQEAIAKRTAELRGAPALNEHERDCLQHALGLNRNRVPFRNHFSAEPGSPDDLVFEELQRRGLARLFSAPREGFSPDNVWHVTQAGVIAAGAPEHAERLST